MQETPNLLKSTEKKNETNTSQKPPRLQLHTLPPLPKIKILSSSNSMPSLPRLPIQHDQNNINCAQLSILAKSPPSNSKTSQSENILICAEINENKAIKNQKEYNVQKGDTLQSIAIKFDISVNWLKMQNKLINDLIFPGDVLNVTPPSLEEALKGEPIHVGLLHSNLQDRSISGTININNNVLNFQPDSPTEKPIHISLLNHIESVVFPHPEVMASDLTDGTRPNTPYIYMMSYFKDSNDQSSMSAIYFGTTYKQANQMKKLIETTALKAQKNKGIVAPNPENIPLKNESSENLATSDGEVSIDNSNFENYNINRKPKQLEPPFTIGSMMAIPPINSQPLPPLSETVMRRRRTLSVLPRIELIHGNSAILNEREIGELRFNFPYRSRNSDWSLLYKLSRDGSSYTTLYHLTEKAAPVVLLIQTNAGEKIGAYISSGLKFSTRYYGNGEIFVFRFNPRAEVFKWSPGRNQYFVCSSQTDISIGGGGHSAIWIDGKLMNAVSEPCPTFNSPQLTKNSRFLCYDIEVWKIGDWSRKF